MSTVQELSVRGRSSLTHCEGCLLSILSGTLPSKLCRNTQQHCRVMSECTEMRWLENLVEADDKNEFHRTRSTRRLLNIWPRAVRLRVSTPNIFIGNMSVSCASVRTHLLAEVKEKCGSRQVAARGWTRTWLEQSTVAKTPSCVEEVFC